MTRKYRPISQEVPSPTTLANATTVSDANVVRVINTAPTTTYLMTLLDASNSVVGTMTLGGGEIALLDKPKTYKVFCANASVKLTSVSYPA
jgi:hypothetical protein